MSTAYYRLPRSTEFAARTPDFNESLLRAHEEGFTLAPESVEHLKKIDRLEWGYWLSKKENRATRDFINNLTDEPERQISELDRLGARLDRQGYGVEYKIKLCDEDAYLRQRDADIAAGLRRR